MILEPAPPRHTPATHSVSFWVRIVLSLALLTWVASRIDWSGAAEGLEKAQPLWFLFAATCLILASVLAGLRWAALMERAGFPSARLRWLSLYFGSSLINQGLPTVMGGDTFRAWQATHPHRAALITSPDKPGFRLAVGTVVLDRGLGLIGSLMLGGLGLLSLGQGWLSPPSTAPEDNPLIPLLFSPTTGQWGVTLLIALTSGLLLLGGILHLRPLTAFLEKALATVHLGGIMPPTRLAFGLGTLFPQLLLAITVHILGVAAMAACLQGVNVPPPISALMVCLPAINILMLLPISISGWGLRESALASVLALWAIPTGLTVLASIGFGLATLIAALPGLPALLTRTHHSHSFPENQSHER